jgi:prepilin signal peptidase PulO-like enzyme (type II secretory pathway)
MAPPTFLQAVHAIAVTWPWFWPAVGAVLGSVFGSFFGCVLYRIPRGMSLRHPPSICPSCNITLTVPDLVPVFSYLALRGRCRHCRAVIGSGTLWIELACAASGILALYLLQPYF